MSSVSYGSEADGASEADETIPVTILSGSLGAGKTTVLNHLLRTSDDDLAVLVNDLGQFNFDAELIEVESDLSVSNGRITELSNGCICCGLGADLRTEVFELAREYEFDYLVIEASGISEPASIARQFVGNPIDTLYHVDTVVTVVNAPWFGETFAHGDLTRQGQDEYGTRPLSDLAIEQVEFCDVLLANKRDLIARADVETIERLLRSLQPTAQLHWTTFGKVSPETILRTGHFDIETTGRSAGWQRALDRHRDGHNRDRSPQGADDGDGETDQVHDHDRDHDNDHRHSPEEYGIESFVYDRYRPFHPERLADWLRSFPESIVRAKGLIWVAGRERNALNLSQTGSWIRIDVNGQWVASLSDSRQASHRERKPDMYWSDEWGDREIRLVFIGSEMNEQAIKNRLDSCLLTAVEMDADWESFENPFPSVASAELVFEESGAKWRLATT